MIMIMITIIIRIRRLMIINLDLAPQPDLSFWGLVSLIRIKIIILILSDLSFYSF
jgi:hypothetical protein